MIARCGWFSFADDLVTLLALQRALLILLSLVLAAPVAGVLLSWLRLDGQALAVLSHQAETVMAGYAGQSLVLAGGTDVGLWVTKHLRDLPHVVYLGEVAELRTITQDAMGGRVIGAAVPLTEAFAALRSDWPELDELAQRFASPPVCNSGTLCGNIANGSPIGDSMPALLALGAELDLRRGARTRRLPLDQFYLDYRRTALEPGEFVAAVRIPPRGPGERLSAWKVSKRYDQDISAVCLAS